MKLRTLTGAHTRCFSPRVNEVARGANPACAEVRDHPIAAGGVEDVRTHPILVALAASLFALAPTQSYAQTPQESASVRDRTRADYEPLGKRLGGFTLNGQLNFTVSQTDNVFANVSGAEQEDTIFTINPNAQLTSNWSRHSLGLYTGAAFRSFQDFSSEDAETFFVRGVGRLDVGSRSSLTGALGYAREVESRTDPDSPVTLAPIEYDRTDASLTAEHTFNRFRATAEVGRTEYDFDGLQSFRDNEENRVRGRLDAEVTPRFGAFVETVFDEREYPNSPGLNSEGQALYVGATANFTDLMRAEIGVGQFERSYDNSLLDTEGLAISGNLQWFVTRLTTVSFNAARGSEELIGAGTATPFVETSFGGRVDHELRRNIILTAGVTGGQREFSGVDRQDDYLYADFGADYLLNRRVALFGRYNLETVDSSGANEFRDFDVNTITFGVSLRL